MNLKYVRKKTLFFERIKLILMVPLSNAHFEKRTIIEASIKQLSYTKKLAIVQYKFLPCEIYLNI